MRNTEARQIAECWKGLDSSKGDDIKEAVLARAYLALGDRCAALEEAVKLRPMSDLQEKKWVLALARLAILVKCSRLGMTCSGQTMSDLH